MVIHRNAWRLRFNNNPKMPTKKAQSLEKLKITAIQGKYWAYSLRNEAIN
jgi:hypothetical protein